MTKAGLYKLVTKPHIFIRDYAKKNKKIKEKVTTYAEKAIDIHVPFHKYYYGLYKIFNEKKAFPLAEKALYKAIALKEKTEYHHLLINLLKPKNQWSKIVEVYEKSLAFNGSVDIKYYLEYTDALAKMNRFEKISKVLKPLAKQQKLNSDGYFKYGYALEQIGEFALAQEAYAKAIEHDKGKNAKELGVGILHQKKGYWLEASEAYKKSIDSKPTNANLRYRYALALDRCYKWAEAEEAYIYAISLNPENIDWYYNLGFVRERQGKYEEAAEAYMYATRNRETHIPYWYYRFGYVLEKAGYHKESCEAFLMMNRINLKPHRYDMYNIEDDYKNLDYFLLDEKITKLEILNKIYEGQVNIDKKSKQEFIDFLINEKTTKKDIWSKLTKDKDEK